MTEDGQNKKVNEDSEWDYGKEVDEGAHISC